MGSLYSKPKIPASVVTYAAPAADTTAASAATTASASTSTSVAASESAATDAALAAESEKAAAAVRRRSLPQTILTSFRGVLDQNAWMPTRKSLLGE
ncbi:MAG: hypothetical protein H6865_05280 [Rhodospirillales bacterium]|nr:hypothetical protein [Alphaproteobacteria bacterium]MCB9987031.1 hypothetical protein [Rhodospirillales bacterium]USO08200.1 MAG: hypothetical protein H6866_03010 [Rhodospirillales bacterium]